MDISAQKDGTVTIGSIEGDGDILLGSSQFVVGRNDLSATFSGTIQNGGSTGGAGGSLVKIGGGRLVLANANTYTGGTSVLHGQLFVNNTRRSGRGSGAVVVEGGKLGGNGAIGVGVKIGTGEWQWCDSGTRARRPYSRHSSDQARSRIQLRRCLPDAGEYYQRERRFSSSRRRNHQRRRAICLCRSRPQQARQGTVFTIISNTSALTIAGTFSNPPGGSIFTANRNTYQVSYEGGDGNDLTLTVVP